MASLNANDIDFTNFVISENDGLDTLEIKQNGNIRATFNENGIKYDNSVSELNAVDVKSAIDEVNTNSSINAISSGFNYIYRYSNSLSGDPTNGFFLFNNLDLSLATSFNISNRQTIQNVDVANLIGLLPQDFYMYIQQKNNNSNFAIFRFENSTKTNNSTYYNFDNMSYVSGITSMVDNRQYVIAFRLSLGSTFKSKQIPALPTTGTNYRLRYNVSSGFSWVSE